MLKNIIKYSGHYFSDILTEKSLVIDIGAGVGVFAREILNKYNCQVIGFEPNNRPLFDKGLNRMVDCKAELTALAKKYPNFTWYNKAVWAKSTELQYFEGGLTIFGRKDKREGLPYKVKSIGINALLNKVKKVDLLKIDVEGSEFEILSAVFNKNLLKCKQVCVEMHLWIGDKFDELITQEDVKKIVCRFEQLGFNWRCYKGHPDYLFYKEET